MRLCGFKGGGGTRCAIAAVLLAVSQGALALAVAVDATFTYTKNVPPLPYPASTYRYPSFRTVFRNKSTKILLVANLWHASYIRYREKGQAGRQATAPLTKEKQKKISCCITPQE